MIEVAENVALAPRTTLELGGPARYLVTARSDADIEAALAFARQGGLPVLILGGGSNLVVADAGFDGLCLAVATRGMSFSSAGDGDAEWALAAAGEPWDALVAETVARGLAGIECLSGIPGSAGATPIQNVGAYGQEVSQTIETVRVFDRESGVARDMNRIECDFGYRDSLFRRAPDRFVVLSIRLRLRRGGAPHVRHGEVSKRLAPIASPTLADVRAAVLAVRADKSMVIDERDPNRRSVGSFFVNPVLSEAEGRALVERAVADGVVATAAEVPCHPAPGGRVKVPAAWLIECSGTAKGTRQGAVGVSTRHALALVHHGGGSTAELLALARTIRARVIERFGITLRPEPILVGVDI